MRLVGFAALLSCIFLDVVVGTDTSSTTAAAAAATTTSAPVPPTCGLQCIVTETLQTGMCDLLNTTCICTNVELNAIITECVSSNCTKREALLTQTYSKYTCHAPTEDRTGLVRIIAIVFLALGLLGFGLRVMSRVGPGRGTWGLDDWAMLLAVAMMIPLNSLSVPISAWLGRDMWLLTPDDVTEFLWFFFWDELLYLGVLPVIKISILLFYLNIFPRKPIRVATYVLIGLNVAYFIVFELISIFQCRPIDGAWKAWTGEYEAKCNNINIQGWAAAFVNILLDLATMILPLGELYNLKMNMKKKVQIMAMFSVGFFVTLVSVLRLKSLSGYATTSNVTQDYVDVGYWSTIEVPVGIICACMPSIRSLFTTFAPKVFGWSTHAKSNYANMDKQRGLSSSHQELSSMSKRGKHAIRVKKEFVMASNRGDDVSAIELDYSATCGDPKATRATSAHQAV